MDTQTQNPQTNVNPQTSNTYNVTDLINNQNLTTPANNTGMDLNALVASSKYDLSNIQNNVSTTQTEVNDLYKQLMGQGEETQALQDQYGVTESTRQLNELQKVSRQQEAQFIAANTRAEAARNTRQETNVVEQNLARQHAIDTVLSNSLIASKQGDITFAQGLVDKAITAKYEPKKLALQNKIQTLEQLNTRAADKRKEVFGLQLKQVEKNEEDEKTMRNFLITANQNGAPDDLYKKAQDVINKGGKPADVAKILGKYTPDYLDYKIKQANLTKTNQEITKERNAIKAAEALAKKRSDGLTPTFSELSEKQQDTTLKLRDKYNQESDTFIKARDAYNKTIASASDPTPAGDIALITNYMKVLDPGSTVRESEFNNAADAASYANKLYGVGIKLTTGKRLTDEQRKDFVSRSKKLYQAQQAEQQKINDNYKMLTTSADIPPEFVIRDINSSLDSQQEALENSWNATNPDPSDPTNVLDRLLKPPK